MNSRELSSFGASWTLRLHEWLLVGMAFLFPLYQDGLSILAIILGANLGVHFARDPRAQDQAFRLSGKMTLPLLLLLFFMLYGVGCLYSDDPSLAGFELQKRLGFVFFPILFALMPLPSWNVYKRILDAFVLGALSACLLGYYSALTSYFGSDDPAPHLLYGDHFAVGVHRGYLAMYLLFALLILIDPLLRGYWSKSRCQRIRGSVLALIILSGIFLTASRTALLTLPLLVLVFVMRSKRVAVQKRLLLILGIFLLLGGFLALFPKNLGRFEKVFNLQQESFEPLGPEERGGSVRNRLMIWSVGWDLYKEHWLVGVGTADDDPALRKAYQEQGYEHLYEKRSDAHCQFLQTAITLGLPGILFLLLIFLKAGFEGLSGNQLLLGACVILFVNALFESVLERQAGILFLSYFFPLLYYGSSRAQAP